MNAGRLIALLLLAVCTHTIARPRAPMPPIPEMAPILWQDHFNQPYYWGGTNPPVVTVEDCGDFAESWSGYGLARSGIFVPAYTLPGIDSEGKTLLRSWAGAVRLWVAPLWSSATLTNGFGPGSPATLIEMAATDGQSAPLSCWTLQIDPDGTRVSLVAQSDTGPVELLAAPIEWESGLARLITLNFGTNGAKLYLDGELAGLGGGTLDLPAFSALLTIGSTFLGTDTAECVIDEVCSFARPLTDNEVAFHYNANVRHASMGPVTEAELEARALARLAMQTTSSFLPAFDGGMRLLGEEYGPEELWIEITGVSSSELAVVLHGTIPGESYQLLSRTNLAEGEWMPEGDPILGQEEQTPATIYLGTRTNRLFLRAKSWVDTDGSGLPDWWQIYWFGTSGADPYADTDQDGWTSIEEYQNGTNPQVFDTPPAPRGLQARFVGAGTALISWARPLGNILGYQVRKDAPGFGGVTTTEVSSDTAFMEDTELLPDDDVEWGYYLYQVRAQYPEGWSEWSAPASLRNEAGTILGQFARGPDGKLRLVLSGVHSGTTGVRLTRYDTSVYPNGIDHFEMPLSSFTNGVGILPDEWAPLYDYNYRWWLQSVSDDGRNGDAVAVGAWTWFWRATYPFYDGREAMKQNLKFQLRAANVDDDLSFYWAQLDGYGWPYNIDEIRGTPEYAYSGYWDMTVPAWTIPPGVAYHEETLNPFILNHLYRNFVFSFDDVTSYGFLDTGLGWPYYDGVPAVVAPKYELQWPQGSTPPGLLLGSGQSEWIEPRRRDWNYIESYGMTETQTGYRLESNARNLYGLHIIGMKNVWSNHPSAQVTIGPEQETLGEGSFYMKVDQPLLETVDYYFAQKSPDHPWTYGPAPVPGQPGFSVTNTTPVIIAAVGDDTFQIGGWAKQRIVNGYPNKFAYLGQYFEKAHKIDSSGQITTNETGILSPYGEFMPLEPGPVALVTMTNWGVNERGTAMVHVISMSVDANHDGVMDLSYTGPDAATSYRPFRFWVNDDNDSGETEGNDIPGWPASHRKTPNGSDNIVNGVRDLVDFFPVSLNIQGLLQALSTNDIQVSYRFRLRQADSALNFIYAGLTLENFQSYLTDTNVAAIMAGATLNEITADGVDLLNGFLYQVRAGGNGVILVEARKSTFQPLVLEIYRDYTLIASSALHLSITGVEEMFRHKNLMAETFPSASSAGAPADRLTDADVPNEPDTSDKNFVFVIGYNNNPTQARGWHSEMYKRMYWSGSQARFYGVTWRGYESQIFGQLTPNFHTNVVNAFRSAPKLAGFLGTLTNETVAAAFSLGNVVALSALSDWAGDVDKFFMIDAAVPIEAIDGSVGVNTNMVHPEWADYPARVWASDWWRLFSSDDHRHELTWSNRLSNFGNTEVYNFYSSGEEVLRTHVGAPPTVTQAIYNQAVLYTLLGQAPQGSFTWCWQEKMKGCTPGDWILGSSYGGWAFSPSYDNPTNFNHMPPGQTAQITDQHLQLLPFFKTRAADADLFPPMLGSYYATNHHYRLLADMVPALSLPVGANAVTNLDVRLGGKANFDMNVDFQNSWPNSRSNTEWHHSDVREVAYTYVYKLFNEIVNQGDLK